ncbi:hypothetical protein DFA_12343 [Cavenderia fasciculata]|uniref:Uncharacterized protein n=1 Tax=Cavenderia fasciculata TaxID=261658 RepID=F4QDE8_CACFS|nr:uncharacterized protein DFA_12343 [Cavenderia fasciculata]EGG14566.1 hypothetical protein DFA_12343 [Cavenderia fasciculata]|eukprot:XP_004366086.1 hypothetical protein DFA_12343 [Cavenderia fasciculata]
MKSLCSINDSCILDSDRPDSVCIPLTTVSDDDWWMSVCLCMIIPHKQFFERQLEKQHIKMVILSIKKVMSSSVASFSKFVGKKIFYLSIIPTAVDDIPLDILVNIYNSLSQDEKNIAYFKYWELSKMFDSRIDGLNYGRDHFWDDKVRSARSLHRCGFINQTNYTEYNQDSLVMVECPSRFKRLESKLKTQYFSLGEKMGRDYERGQVSYVNGMGNTIGWAGHDASKLSDSMCDGVNFYCVYLPTYVVSKDNFSPNHQDLTGFLMDVTRHLATTEGGGENSLTSCLIVQQWFDYLSAHPTKHFLQICASDGGTFVNAAINLFLKHALVDYIERLNVIGLAPGTTIMPRPDQHFYSHQVVNLIKKEDTLISTFGTGSDMAGKSPNVLLIPHTVDHPHNFTSADYIVAVKPFIDCFKSTGFIMNKP